MARQHRRPEGPAQRSAGVQIPRRVDSEQKLTGRSASPERARRRRRAHYVRLMSSGSSSEVDFFQQEGDWNQRGGEQRQRCEDVYIGKIGGLVHQGLSDPGDRLALSVACARSLMGEKSCDLSQSFIIGEGRSVDVFGETRLMKLLALREQGLRGGDADAAAEIARDIDQRRGLA